MTDKKFTDEEIIKALKCCACETIMYCEDQCPFYERCMKDEQIASYALDLINRQKLEIERLKECPKCVYEYDGEVVEYCVQGPCPNFKTVEQIKSEAVKEFADEFKSRCIKGGIYPAFVKRQLENVKKEMVGENNG